MNITTSSYCPDSTYFRTGDVEPDIKDQKVICYTGEGSRRGWGKPGNTSTVVLNDDDLCAIHVGFHHKNGGSQFWRYYTTDGTTIKRLTWKALTDDQRQKVLDNLDKAPNWADCPGKLRTEYEKPPKAPAKSYKLVQVIGGRMYSLYDRSFEYRIGETLHQPARAGHNGGFYSHPTAEQVKALWDTGCLVSDSVKDRSSGRFALLQVKTGGKCVRYPNGKIATTEITPVEIVETW